MLHGFAQILLLLLLLSTAQCGWDNFMKCFTLALPCMSADAFWLVVAAFRESRRLLPLLFLLHPMPCLLLLLHTTTACKLPVS